LERIYINVDKKTSTVFWSYGEYMDYDSPHYPLSQWLYMTCYQFNLLIKMNEFKLFYEVDQI